MPVSATTLTPSNPEASSSEGLDVGHVDFRHRLSRQVDLAAAQAVAIGERMRKRQIRGTICTAIGVILSAVGLAGSVAIAVESGTVSTLWWLTLPTWIAAATSTVVLLQDRGGALSTLYGRSVGATALARELSRTFAAASSRAERDALLAAAGIGRLSALLDEELKVTGLALGEQTKGDQPRRRHRRLVPHATKVIVTTADGRRLRATIADVSLSGIAMTECLPRLSRDDRVSIGQTSAKVIRCWDKGIAFEFETELDPMTFNEKIVL